MSGSADLIVETGDGVWVIDHKSDLIEDPLQAFLHYLPQLDSYAKALADEGRNAQGIAINWIRRGEMVLKRLEKDR